MTDTDPTPAEAPAADGPPGVDPLTSVCPMCGAVAIAGDRFCEACGGDLPVPSEAGHADGEPVHGGSGCTSCGGPVAADGYCQQCGMKQPDPHDHEEIDLVWAAGVTDRGLRHATNEDAMALVAPRPGLGVAVVCDGVSSSANAQQAAAAAASAAVTVLLDAAGSDPVAGLMAAAESAQSAVRTVRRVGKGESPSCTFVAAVVHDGQVTVGWIGDSRAYWLGADGDKRLTDDDSWAAVQVADGSLSEADAEADPRAHGITKWLGADAPDTVPRTQRLRPDGPGHLVVCSDGLWNYASSPGALVALLKELPPEATPIAIARHFTDFARESGGQDNITVAVVAL